MSFLDAIRALNGLKRRRVIRDYVVFDAVAATAYVEPVLTQDLDIIVLVDSDEEFWDTFRRVGDRADGLDGMHHVLGGRPVQMFPSTLKAIYRDTLVRAKSSRIGSIRVKVASPAHLVILALEAFRLKDKLRIGELLKTSSFVREGVYKLLEEFDDDEQTLRVSSKHLSERLFAEKEKWHRRQARMSFARKLAVLDDLFEMEKEIPMPGLPDKKPDAGSRSVP